MDMILILMYIFRSTMENCLEPGAHVTILRPISIGRFARAGGANITQLSLYLSNLCIFCPPDCSRTRHESWTTFNFLGVPARLIFHVIKIGHFTRAGKTTAMENGHKRDNFV
jgi:hypothetical protein